MKLLWDKAIIILDANVLLRLFRLNQKSVSEILDLLNTMRNRIWIPYQVGLEYNKNRLEKIKESELSYNTIVDIVQNFIIKCETKMREYSGFGVHPVVDMESGINEILEFTKKKMEIITKEVSERSTSNHYSELHDRIGKIFEGKIGKDHADDVIEKLIKKAKDQLERGIGPGSADYEERRRKKLPDRECCGDFLIWEAMIEEAKSRGCSVIFVTEDAKSDWWLRKDGKTIGPLPELRRDFHARVDNTIYFYRFQQFLEISRNYFGKKISDDTVNDVKETGEDELDISDSSELDQRQRAMARARSAMDRELLLRKLARADISARELDKIRQSMLALEQRRSTSGAVESLHHERQQAELRRLQYEDAALSADLRHLEFAADDILRRISNLDTREIREGNERVALEISKLMDERENILKQIRSLNHALAENSAARRGRHLF